MVLTELIPLQGHCRYKAIAARLRAQYEQPHRRDLASLIHRDQNAGRIAAQVPPEQSTGSAKPPRQRGRCALSTGPPHRAASGAAGRHRG
ncbi:hypothetical protein [Pseudonocardia sp.]|uniref:hypothetical protein n=1 Tax=Pseudonocardia sp. TaxID=60912 RepID=UPI002F3F8319